MSLWPRYLSRVRAPGLFDQSDFPRHCGEHFIQFLMSLNLLMMVLDLVPIYNRYLYEVYSTEVYSGVV